MSCSVSGKQGYILTGSLLEQFSNSLVRVSVLPGKWGLNTLGQQLREGRKGPPGEGSPGPFVIAASQSSLVHELAVGDPRCQLTKGSTLRESAWLKLKSHSLRLCHLHIPFTVTYGNEAAEHSLSGQVEPRSRARGKVWFEYLMSALRLEINTSYHRGGPLVQGGGDALVPTSPDQRCLCSHFPSSLGPNPRGISQHLKLPHRPALGQPSPQRYPCVHTRKHFTADCRQPEWSAWKILYWGFGDLISTVASVVSDSLKPHGL